MIEHLIRWQYYEENQIYNQNEDLGYDDDNRDAIDTGERAFKSGDSLGTRLGRGAGFNIRLEGQLSISYIFILTHNNIQHCKYRGWLRIQNVTTF